MYGSVRPYGRTGPGHSSSEAWPTWTAMLVSSDEELEDSKKPKRGQTLKDFMDSRTGVGTPFERYLEV